MRVRPQFKPFSSRNEDPRLPASVGHAHGCTRRRFLLGAGAGALTALAMLTGAHGVRGVEGSQVRSGPDAGAFGFDHVCRLARENAGRAFRQESNSLTDGLAHLSYDEYRKIRFRPACSIWKGERVPFQIQLLHRGALFSRRVRINLVENGRPTPVPWRRDWFNYETTQVDEASLSGDLGYAGFRLHYPINRSDYFDEVIVFVGASYFRAVARDLCYGASCRGLATDIGLDRQEEFPTFDEFWIVRPGTGAQSITIYALLDSVSCTGAYEFIVRPGEITRIDVRAVLFGREPLAKIGLAPITSMFLRGEESLKPADDFRPEVHDSDGLLIANGTGEWLWRPLANPARIDINRFAATSLRGFGLLQRDREFDHYLDREAHYDRRPSIWVEPIGNWPAGSVELFEAPQAKETAENVNAYWVLANPGIPADGLRFEYRMSVLAGDPPAHTGGKAISTWSSSGNSGRRRYVVLFDSPDLRRLDLHADLDGIVTVTGGQAAAVSTRKNEETGAWEVSFDCIPADAGSPVEMRAFLRSGAAALTETWSARWNPS